MQFIQPNEGEIIFRIAVALVLSMFLGLQRERRKAREKTPGVAGMRTHVIVAMGSALISAIGALAFASDPIRLAASILTGIGFLGAGTVIADSGRIRGLVNAATIWVAASVGIAVGLGFFISSIVTTIFAILILELKRFEKVD